MAPLLLLALSMTGPAGCKGPDDSQGPTVALAVAPGSITLTYICGNSFRVRNTNAGAVTVAWDVYNTTEKGTLTLSPKPTTGPYSETYFTSANKGTVRLFESGTLIQTKANGNKPVCAIPSDTTRPAIPDNIGLPTTSSTVPDLAFPSAKYFTDHIGIRFAVDASGPAVRQVLTKYQLTIMGGNADHPSIAVYYVRLATPRDTWAALAALTDSIRNEPGVIGVLELEFGGAIDIRGRYPVDAAISPARENWFTTRDAAQQTTINSLNAIRAPLAWGCETGAYGAAPPPIAILDLFFDGANPDLNVAKTLVPLVADTLVPSTQTFGTRAVEHGFGVAGVAAASGDNGRGMSGVAWGAPLRLYALRTGNSQPINLFSPVLKGLRDALANGVGIWNWSTAMFNPRRQDVVLYLRAVMALYLDNPANLLVIALPYRSDTTEAGAAYTLADIAAGNADSIRASDVAIAQLAIDPTHNYKSQIIFVGGTVALTGKKWRPSDLWTGGSMLAAPSDAIVTLVAGTSPTLAQRTYGTSFAAPMVAGTAALLRTMAPNLTGAEVTDYLLRGARADRDDPMTGRPVPASDIGVPGVYQLDAYGSLMLLAKEHPETPICGFPVVTRSVQDPVTGAPVTSVLLQRPGQTEQEVYRGYVNNVTVAQGGRIIGIDDYSYATNVIFQFGTWEKGTPRARGLPPVPRD